MPQYSDFVRDDYGRPIPGALAKLYAIDGETLVDSAVTGADGQFTVTGPDAKCVLQVSYGGVSERSIILVGDPPEYKGDTGPANSTYATLAEMKAAAASNLSYILTTPNGAITYAYVTGDFTGKADDRYIVKLDAVPLTTGALIRDSSVVSVKDFGAKGDFIADDTDRIQNAIDFIAAQPNGGVVTIPPGVYKLVYRNAVDGGVICLILRDKVTLQGLSKHGSILKLANAAIGPGTYGRMIVGSPTGRITNCGLVNLKIDGNRSSQGLWAEQGNGGNVVIGNCESITIRDVVSIGANGQGIQVVGTRLQNVGNLLITGCEVSDTAGSTVSGDGTIVSEYNGNGCGIQVSYAINYIIAHNIVTYTKDNCIDTYNENVDYSTNPPSVFSPAGGQGLITDNVLQSGRVGIFPETSAKIKVSNNYISSMRDIGISINRINSPPSGIELLNNTIDTCPVLIRIGGDCDSTPGVIIKHNLLMGFLQAQHFGIVLDKTSYVLIENNTFAIGNPVVPLVTVTGSAVSFCKITGNRYFGNPNGGTLLYNPNSTTLFLVSSDDWLSVDNLSNNRADNYFDRHNVRVTGYLEFRGLQTFIDNGTALAAGLAVGMTYKTSGGDLKVVVPA